MGAIYDEFEKQLRAKLMIQQMSFFFFFASFVLPGTYSTCLRDLLLLVKMTKLCQFTSFRHKQRFVHRICLPSKYFREDGSWL